jgi:hypothetical protein
MPISIYSVELKDFFKYVDFISNSMYYNMYLKHFFIRTHFSYFCINYSADFLEIVYNVIFFDFKISRDLKFSLFSQIFFEITTTNFNDVIKKY